MVHVPYRGTGEAVLAITSGEVSLGFNDVQTTMPYMSSGRLRGIAVTSLKRSPAVPELPALAELGYPGFQSGVWYRVLAPARTRPEIIARLNSELVKIVKIVRTPEFSQSLAAEGAVPVASTPEFFGECIKTETKRWARITKAANIASN